MAWRRIATVVIILAACLIALGPAANFLVDWLWFSAVGYVDVFWTILGAKVALFLVVFAASAVLLWLNGSLACRFAERQGHLPLVVWGSTSAQRLAALSAHLPQRLLWRLVAGGVLILAALIALGEAGNWDVALRFIRQAPYGQSDPLYGKDIGFYLFSLPAYVALKNWMLLTLVLSALVAGAVYSVSDNLTLDEHGSASPRVIAHGSALLGLFFAVKAWSYWIDRYLLLYDDNAVVVGAAYTDVHVELPMLSALVWLSSVAAFASWANMWVRSYRLPAVGAVLVFGGSFVLALAFPALFQRFYVKPNELRLETPYIQRNIALTREAYNLGRVTVKPFPAEQGLTLQSLQDNRPTIDNIRLWDWQPLMDTYAQLQEIRTYYKFHDIDIDRYEIDGSYQQVMLSARELEPARLPSNAQTWVNLHLLFTHGDGVVMSPVTRKSAEGLPIFYLQDIPPVASGGPVVQEPRIYFGQGADSYVMVNGSTPEFDYPKGKDNVYGAYKGADGVAVGGMMRRTLFAWYFDDLNILLTNYITSESSNSVPSQHPESRSDNCSLPPPGPRPLRGGQRRAALLDARRLHYERVVPLCRAPSWRRNELHSKFGEGRHRRLQRIGGLLCSGSSRSSDRNLPAHFPWAVQVVRGHASGSAKARPLPGGSLPHPGPALPRLSHGRA